MKTDDRVLKSHGLSTQDHFEVLTELQRLNVAGLDGEMVSVGIRIPSDLVPVIGEIQDALDREVAAGRLWKCEYVVLDRMERGKLLVLTRLIPREWVLQHDYPVDDLLAGLQERLATKVNTWLIGVCRQWLRLTLDHKRHRATMN